MMTNETLGARVDSLAARVGTLDTAMAELRTEVRGFAGTLNSVADAVQGLATMQSEGRRTNWPVVFAGAALFATLVAAVLSPINSKFNEQAARIERIEERGREFLTRDEADARSSARDRLLQERDARIALLIDTGKERDELNRKYLEEYARRVALEAALSTKPQR